MALYKGYSSFEYQQNKSFRLTDVELVKMDLLNHIYTRRGERVKMPKFGTRIPDLLFDQVTEDTIEIVHEDLEYVVDYDPRVRMMDLQVNQDPGLGHVILATLQVLYIELNMTVEIPLRLEFQNGGT